MNWNKHLVCIPLMLWTCASLSGQLENNVWKFGHTGAGLDFSNCTPAVLTNGTDSGVPFEGQSAISHPTTGELRFYTDGFNIYDATNAVMSGGANAGLSNTLAQTLILQKPLFPDDYYVFTPDVQGGLAYNTTYPDAFGINYATVDMSLNDGLGQVTSVFNALKDTSNCEMLTAVYQPNGVDLWLIGHEYGSNNFFAFSITSAGIDPTPVISSVGPVVFTPQAGTPGNSNMDAIGELKASTDGALLAFTTYYNGITCLANFDKATGAVSNAVQLDLENGGYGTSFSPDNTKLYFSVVDTSGDLPGLDANGELVQFDLSSGDLATIQASKVVLHTDPNGSFRSLKIGPDGKIYVSRGNGQNYLGVIHAPNETGIAADFEFNGVYLAGMEGRWGLNNAVEDTTWCSPILAVENLEPKGIRLFPNPAQDKVRLELPTGNANWEFTVSNVMGKVMFSKKANANATDIDLRSLPVGVYLVCISSADFNRCLRLVKSGG